MNRNTLTSTYPICPPLVSLPTLPTASVEGHSVARSESRKLLPSPRPLKARQILALRRLMEGASRATGMSLATLQEQTEAMSRSLELAPSTRLNLELLAADLEGFLRRFDPQAPLRCAASILWLRNALDEIVQLQASPDATLLSFRVFNATLISVGLEIIRILDLQLSTASTVGNPVWHQEPGIPKLRRHRVGSKTSGTVTSRAAWSSTAKRTKAT